MPSTTINYGPCKNEATGLFEYCQIYGIGTQRQAVHPIGHCRDNKLPGKTPCKHKTEEAARTCYQGYQVLAFFQGRIGIKDLLMVEDFIKRLDDASADAKKVHAQFLKNNAN